MTPSELEYLFKKIVRVGFNHNIPQVYFFLPTKEDANTLYNELDLYFISEKTKLIIHKNGLFISLMSLIDNKILTTNHFKYEDVDIIQLDKFIKKVGNKEQVLLGKGYIDHISNTPQIIDVKNVHLILRLNGYQVV